MMLVKSYILPNGKSAQAMKVLNRKVFLFSGLKSDNKRRLYELKNRASLPWLVNLAWRACIVPTLMLAMIPVAFP